MLQSISFQDTLLLRKTQQISTHIFHLVENPGLSVPQKNQTTRKGLH